MENEHMTLDYLKMYSLEEYLFEKVRPRFIETGKITPEDFYMIIIWKSVRAKRKTRDRLRKISGNFNKAVEEISEKLHGNNNPEYRLKILMKDWKFRLPTASAILTVLDPECFSVYDARVCKQLGKFKELSDRSFSSNLWKSYQDFVRAVETIVPGQRSLRNKDRYLWGKSFYEDIIDDLKLVS